MTEKIKAVIFDMDGVLLDTESICDRTWDIALRERGLEPDLTVLNSCRGCNKTDSMLKLKEKYGSGFDAEGFLQRTSILFHEIEKKEGIPLMPYVKETLDYLCKKYILCLASSTREESVRKELTDAGIINYFKTITTGDMVTHSKPDPEIYLLAASSIGVDPKECIAIEDSYNGVRSSVAAGIATVMVPDMLPPTEEMKKITMKICSSLDELKGII